MESDRKLLRKSERVCVIERERGGELRFCIRLSICNMSDFFTPGLQRIYN